MAQDRRRLVIFRRRRESAFRSFAVQRYLVIDLLVTTIKSDPGDRKTRKTLRLVTTVEGVSLSTRSRQKGSFR